MCIICDTLYLHRHCSPPLPPVVVVQLHHPLLQLPRLVGRKAEVAYVIGAVLLRFIVAQLGLHGVGAQEGVSDEGAGQSAGQDVVPQLQAQVVPAQKEEEG